MQYFEVEGGIPLKGTVTPSGSKNEALPVIAASLLTEEPVILENIPNILDVRNMVGIIQELGAQVEWTGPNTLIIQAKGSLSAQVNPELAKKIRASILLAGPLFARKGRVVLPPPGGDVIGKRRLDTHFHVLTSLGARVDVERFYKVDGGPPVGGTRIFLDEQSVTATENALMAAVLARGTTIIENAACEPSVQGLARMLRAMGAKISGEGTNRIVVEGVERLRGTKYRVAGDYLEAASFAMLAAVAGEGVLVEDFPIDGLGKIGYVFRKLGIAYEPQGEDCFVPGPQELVIKPDLHGAIPTIDDAPWPQFPTDLMSVAITTATQALGTIVFFEKMYDGRMFFVDTLINMGARIILCDPHRVVVVGPSRLIGTRMESPDIRAGMALLMAALVAEGTSRIWNIAQIDRGYEAIEEKLIRLGAHIRRVGG